MKQALRFLARAVGDCLLFLIAGWFFISTDIPRAPSAEPGTPEWVAYVSERYFDISDGEGHGPDPGSEEWLHSVEWKAGLQDHNDLPFIEGCKMVQQQLERRVFIFNRPLGWSFMF
ncbi:hypothetical protein EN871_04255 [bacterium M00.F.Ca.ET.228.01.1.1]|uniref:hypothetical protein n=1 Tax=Paraburkholderia phenoliruptrix TaxID=252970 RepID=UPI0010922FD6|nr:hypothetical protein [Paraburkholderia phenoliruptrix]TGP48020.1 hypothetical protein EN871_04255 [bacterium M00.F.Ca.ET.228.01.1.1]TGS05812.1 hypothetical protein EN834_04255 [bacterium M00.F.Ca.ET.191.01.1.1]TGU10749.1 hypothetical protein EN798_04255 [bacterium M00.F.Ca.ET.155.01.1.1]MBW0445161.1 hypothetical protein [Paraburkholderia phenoliruptrix]MBW9095926.1 hypothetical protein [Paraburkholderia phenoliruptrix]